MKKLSSFLEGVGRCLDLAGYFSSYSDILSFYYPYTPEDILKKSSEKALAEDLKKLGEDWKKVGNDLKSAMNNFKYKS